MKDYLMSYRAAGKFLEDVMWETWDKVGRFLYAKDGYVRDQEIAFADELWGHYDLFPKYVQDILNGRTSLQVSIDADIESIVLKEAERMDAFLAYNERFFLERHFKYLKKRFAYRTIRRLNNVQIMYREHY